MEFQIKTNYPQTAFVYIALFEKEEMRIFKIAFDVSIMLQFAKSERSKIFTCVQN